MSVVSKLLADYGAQILTGVGSGISAIGSLQQGNAASSAAQYNAKTAERSAELTLAQTAENERRQRALFEQQLGDITATQGNSGTFGGSNLTVLANSAANAELEALTTRYEGEFRAKMFEEQAQLLELQSKQAKKAGNIGALGSLLGGATKIFSMSAS
jgi:hypothetical protein